MNPRFDHLANPVGAKVMKYIVSANKVVWDSTLPATTRHLVETFNRFRRREGRVEIGD